MNRHFNDAKYYARRTGESLYTGLRQELEPYLDEAAGRYYDYRGIERPTEPTRIEQLQLELDQLEERASGEAQEAVQSVRQRIGGKRNQ